MKSILSITFGACAAAFLILANGCVNSNPDSNASGQSTHTSTFFAGWKPVVTTNNGVVTYRITNSIHVNLTAVTSAVKSILSQITPQQRAQLQTNSPDTLKKIQHNDEIAQREKPDHPTPPAADTKPTANTATTPEPMRVKDIRMMTAAGLKSEIIIEEIKKSGSNYTPDELREAKEGDPKVAEEVIKFMSNPTAA